MAPNKRAWRLDRNVDRYEAELMLRREKSVCYGGKGGGGSSDPRVGEAAMKQAETGQAALDFAMKQYNDSKPRQATLDQQADATYNLNNSMAQTSKDRGDYAYGRYKSLGVPLENTMASEAASYGTAADQNAQAGRVISDVNQQSANQQGQLRRSVASMGVNPNSGKFAAMEAQNARANTALAAGGANAARLAVRDRGIGLRAGAASYFSGGQNQAGQNMALSSGMMGAGMTATGQSNQYDLARAGLAQGGYTQAMQGYGGSGSLLQQQQNSVNNMNAASAQGTGQFIGAGITAAATIF